MSDPRNVAHDKKVAQEKQHEHAPSADTKSEKGRKPEAAAEESAQPSESAPSTSPAAAAQQEHQHAEHEKSVAVLSKLKEMEFHARGNIETLAGLTLTVEDELKQKEFSDPIGALYSAQDDFHSRIGALIESYEAKCDSLKPTV